MMVPNRHKLRKNFNARFYCGFAAVAAGFVFLACAMASGAERPTTGAWLAIPCPKHLAPGPWEPIPGAKKTGWIPAAYSTDLPQEYSSQGFHALGVSFQDFLAGAGREADRLLANFEPDIIRDERGVAQFALLTSTDHTASAVLAAPSLGKRFVEVFGAELLVAVPSRDVVIIFPGLAGPHAKFSERVLFAYKNSAYPASLELFSVRDGIVQAVGDYKE